MHKMSAWSVGFAMFSMFFGAGNIVFPIMLGQYSGEKNIYAMLGMLLTAVIVPFLGLASMLTYNGDYKKFFARIGKVPAYFIILIVMLLIGPFAGIPRCITLSYSTLSLFSDQVSLASFSLIACLVIFAMTIKKNRVMEILGFVLTPVLLISLSIIIIRGLYHPPQATPIEDTALNIFLMGLTRGYDTMDLFAAFFFSIVIIPAFKMILGDNLEKKPKQVMALAVKSSLIGAFLLGTIYIGMSFVASFYANELVDVPIDLQMGKIAIHILGPYAGLVANSATILACLTTAVTVTIVFAEFVRVDLFQEKIGYLPVLTVTLILSFLMSQMGFTSIISLMAPIFFVLCPGLIVLAAVNLLHKTTGFKPVKLPVFLTFAVTFIIVLITGF